MSTHTKKQTLKPRANGTTKPVVFSLQLGKGHDVFVAGGFNDWNPNGNRLTYDSKKGTYAATLRLRAGGVYEYKFLVDGVWQADPANEHAVPNPLGTFNSVVHVA